ncbi:MAG: TolC family protein [Elusimicrobiota bacterium]
MSSSRRFRFPLALALSVRILAFSNPAVAQPALEPAGKKRTLAEFVGLAIQNTKLLGAQDARVEEKRLSAAQARAWPGFSAEFLLGRKSASDTNGPRYEFSAAQPLSLAGKPGLRGSLFDLESESWRVQRMGSEIFVTLTVAQGAYEYAANRRKATFAEKRRKRFEVIESYLSGRVFATPQRKVESRIVRNHLKNVAADAIQSEAGFKTSLEKLKVYMPLDSGAHPEIEVMWLSGTKEFDEKECVEKALANNPGLRVQRLAVQGAGLEKTLASREGLPDAALVASYEQSKAAETEKNYGLGLSLAFPSWNRNRSAIMSTEQRKLAEERQLGYEEQKLKAELSKALIEYEAARQTVLKYPQELMAELEIQLQDADEGFRKGQVDLLTFLELDDSASATFSRAYDAQVQLASKAAELLTMTADKDALTQLGSL